MSRPLRLEFPGAVYHVTSRGDRREPIYRDDEDRRVHLGVLEQALDRFDAEVLAYCLMGNHFHLVLHTRQANLSRLMRHLNGVYTQRFNRRHGLAGHLFQGRFTAILVDRDRYLLALCRYVERNPVAAGMVPKVGDWEWSSYRAHVGQAPTPDWLDSDGLHAFLLGRTAITSADRRKARVQYAKLVDEAGDGDLWESGLRQQVFLGDEAFVQRMTATAPAVKAAGVRDAVPKRQTRHAGRIEAFLDADAVDRDRAMLAAYREGGFTMSRIAAHLGLSVSRVSRVIARVEAKGKT